MTTVVELTGDESRLLRSLQRVEDKEKSLKREMDKVGQSGEQAGRKIERGMADAGKGGTREINKMLRELRRTGPEGRKQAKAIEDHFRATGKFGRQSMESIVTSIGKIDDAAGKVARKSSEEFRKAGKAGQSAFGDAVLGKITAVAGGIFSVGTAVSQVTQFLREQEAILDRALDKNLTLAQAQQEAAKNLAGFTDADRQRLLEQEVPRIARRTGFSNLAQLTSAMGTAASSGGDVQQTIAAVEAAAQVERLTPENIGATAAGAISVMNRTGLTDARQAIALLQTAGTQAKITDPSAMIRNMPRALGATMATLPDQEVSQASRQAAALFANITQAGEDVRGESSATFQIDFSNRLGKFFSDLEQQGVELRSELQAIENKRNPLERDLVRAEELRSVIPQIEAATDPGTLFGRIETLQRSPELAREFVGEGFGEQAFRVILKDAFNANSEFAKRLRESAGIIQADTGFFQREVANQQTGSPQRAAAFAQGLSQAGIAAQQATDVRSAGLAQVRQIMGNTLTETNPGGPAGFLGGLSNWGWGMGRLRGDNAISEGLDAITRLGIYRQEIASDGIEPAERPRLQTLDASIRAIRAVVENQLANGQLTASEISSTIEQVQRIQRGGPNSTNMPDRQSTEILKSMLDVLRQQLDAQQRSGPMTAPPPNYSGGLQSGAAAAQRSSF